MPVRLNTIPDAESYPAPPARIKWLSALLLMLSVGVAITSLFASDELAKNGPHFWGLACGVPAFIWSLVASVRWLFFITQYIRADAWNKRREEVILQETRRGRRAGQLYSGKGRTAGDFRASGTEEPGTDGRIRHRAVAGKPVDANRADAVGPAASS